jgi:hypothetical protein
MPWWGWLITGLFAGAFLGAPLGFFAAALAAAAGVRRRAEEIQAYISEEVKRRSNSA